MEVYFLELITALIGMSVVSPTSRSFRLHDQSRFAYTIEVVSPTLKSFHRLREMSPQTISGFMRNICSSGTEEPR